MRITSSRPKIEVCGALAREVHLIRNISRPCVFCCVFQARATRVSARAIQAAGTQNSKATNDAVATTVGAIVFWPALLFIKGDSTTGPEPARLKGEMEAIEQASTRRNCGITFQRQAAS